ncbi:MAG: DUF1385 domain-containing protein [Candidatus Atribacteria bacterium]|nr:DUF1385 domain-containing protein [Candidatus Atribacteria bacterium]
MGFVRKGRKAVGNLGKKLENKKVCLDVGGQALIEGVMMRTPFRMALAVRKKNGDIAVEVRNTKPLAKRNRFFGLPIIRGIVGLVDSLIVGWQALSYSASVVFEEEEEKLSTFDMGVAILLALGLFVGLFVALPTFLASFVDRFISSTVLYNLVEGCIRVGIFLVYLTIIANLKDIRRVFEYHGAEHKAIFTFENGEELKPENAEKFTTLHPRCGTNWLIVVMIVSIFVFSLLGRPGIIGRVLTRILVVPLVAGLAYEVIRFVSRHRNNSLIYSLSLPGLWLQRITTREPDRSQLEVAFSALKGSLGEEGNNVAGEN